MKHLLKLTAGILIFAGNFLVQAQFRAPGGLPPGFQHALLDVLADGASFYGRARIQSSNGPDKEPSSVSCNVAVLSGCLRLEFDSFEPGTNLPQAEIANLKQMHSVYLLRPDQNRMFMIYPDFKSYVEIVYAKTTGTDPVPHPSINKTPLGMETIGIQPCIKSEWSVTEANGEHYDATVWAATNLNNFPIQIKLGQPPVLVEFDDWHMDPPSGDLFTLPTDYTKYDGIPANIQRAVEKTQNTNSP